MLRALTTGAYRVKYDKSQFLYRLGARTQLTLPNTTMTLNNMGMHSTTITITITLLHAGPTASPTNDFDE